jgi:hypothetical protein
MLLCLQFLLPPLCLPPLPPPTPTIFWSNYRLSYIGHIEHVSTLCAINDTGASQCQHETNGSCRLAMLMTYLHADSKMPNSNVSLANTIKHIDKKILMVLPCYMTFCRTTNDSMQIALRFYASAKMELVITHLGYDTVFVGSPLPLFQDSVLIPPLHTCTATIIITSLIH